MMTTSENGCVPRRTVYQLRYRPTHNENAYKTMMKYDRNY